MAKGLSMRLTAEISDRGLDPQRLAEKFGVHSAQGPGGGDFLCIPYRRQGAIKNRKFRETMVPGQSGGRSWQDKQEKGAVRMLYNEDALRDAKLKGQPVIITEGEPDLWALDLAGYERIVGWPDGAPEFSIPVDADSPKYKPLEDALASGLFSIENMGGKDVPIIVAADGDEAGAILLQDLSLRLGRARCKFLTYPLLPDAAAKEIGRARCKDIGEVLEFYGPAGVVRTIERAQWVAAPGVYRMSELPPKAVKKALDIGMPGLDIRLRLGDWSVWTGIPSHGKTSLVNDITCRLVENYTTDAEPFVCTFASLEQDPQVDHRRNLLWWLGEKHPAKQQQSELEYGESWIDRHFRFLVPNEDADVSIDWLLDAAATSVIRDGAKVVVVDPWNEMDHDRLPGESVTDYTGRAIKAFRRFANKMGVHLMIVAHPTKMQQRADGKFPVPTLYSISDSAHWYNKCDVGVIVHREGNQSLVWVQKTRYEDQIGRPGMFDAAFNHGTRRFEILGVHDRDSD